MLKKETIPACTAVLGLCVCDPVVVEADDVGSCVVAADDVAADDVADEVVEEAVVVEETVPDVPGRPQAVCR
jgi:hypothetical protein